MCPLAPERTDCLREVAGPTYRRANTVDVPAVRLCRVHGWKSGLCSQRDWAADPASALMDRWFHADRHLPSGPAPPVSVSRPAATRQVCRPTGIATSPFPPRVLPFARVAFTGGSGVVSPGDPASRSGQLRRPASIRQACRPVAAHAAPIPHGLASASRRGQGGRSGGSLATNRW